MCMRSSGSTLTPFDPKIERTTRAIRRANKKTTTTQRILVEDQPLISYDFEEEITMVVVPLQTMRDYCKRTDEGQVLRGFLPTDPANFDIKNFMLSGLRYNL